MKKPLLFLFILLTSINNINAQDEDRNTITTASPFLLIAPDARSGGMGDMGVGTSPDANSLHYNPAKYAFSESQYTIQLSFTPWLRNLTNDVYLGNLVVSNRLDEKSAWSAGIKYFSLGSIDLTNDLGISIGSENPNEFAIDGSYALKLSESFSMAVALSYIHSNMTLKIENSDIQTINTFAVGVSGYYQSEEINYGDFNGKWRGGFNISNIGPKVQLVVGGKESFIPTNLRLGGGFDFILDDLNTISANLEFNKLLVPTPPIRDTEDIDEDGDTLEILEGKDDDVGFFAGMFQSFGDAPDGFSEELKEFTWAVGAEYMYDRTIGIRAGYFNESDYKGGRKYFTLGAGFKFKNSNIDFSYLINSSDVNNPLENTLRFSLSLNLGDIFEDY